MLKKKERLTREAFNRFFSIGKRVHSPIAQIIYTHHHELHVSVVVSKKIAKHAVKRNKIRRRIYDIVRHYRAERGMSGVFIIIVKPSLLTMEYDRLKEEVRTSLGAILKRNFNHTK